MDRHLAAGAAIEKEARPSDLVRFNVIDNDTPEVPRVAEDALAAVTLLLDSGVKAGVTTSAGDTPMHAAASNAARRGSRSCSRRSPPVSGVKPGKKKYFGKLSPSWRDASR